VSLDSWSHILEVNQGKDHILQNKEARQAVAKSIDRKEITERLLNNGSIASHGLVPREFVFNPETKKDFRDEKPLVNEFNQKEGTQIWQKFLSESGTKEVSLTLLASDQDENKHITEFIQFSLEETLPNTKITIEMMPEKNLLERRKKGDFDLILNRVGPDFQDPLTFMNQYISTSDSNMASYQNKSYDELLKEAEKLATQPEERWNKLVEAEDLLLKDAGVIPIYQSANTALQRPTYDGLIHHLFGPPNYYGKIKMK
jgi:oligopeptide transport system substrate-binding protein